MPSGNTDFIREDNDIVFLIGRLGIRHIRHIAVGEVLHLVAAHETVAQKTYTPAGAMGTLYPGTQAAILCCHRLCWSSAACAFWGLAVGSILNRDKKYLISGNALIVGGFAAR